MRALYVAVLALTSCDSLPEPDFDAERRHEKLIHAVRDLALATNAVAITARKAAADAAESRLVLPPLSPAASSPVEEVPGPAEPPEEPAVDAEDVEEPELPETPTDWLTWIVVVGVPALGGFGLWLERGRRKRPDYKGTR